VARPTHVSKAPWLHVGRIAAGAVVVAGTLLLVSDNEPNEPGVKPIESRGDVSLAVSDSSDVVAVIAAYHAALAAGDSTAALALLGPDAIIVESGGIETRDEYRSHHLPGDIAFARGVKSERGPMRVIVQGDIAWATSTSTTQGEYRGRQINSLGAELMVLSRTPNGWKIRAIHWSSRARRPS
jgi:ketosteroid isomerase-like protein